MGYLEGKLYHLKSEVVAGKETASIMSGDLSNIDMTYFIRVCMYRCHAYTST